MEYQLLEQVVSELAAVLAGARVERIYQDAGNNLCIINRSRKNYTLLLSPDPLLPRLHLVTKKPAAADAPAGFVLYLRSHLTGSTISDIALLNEDRIASFRFTRAGKEYRLIFELFGTSANLFLVDGSAMILSLYRAAPPGERAGRSFLPGMRYALPEKKLRPEQTAPAAGSAGSVRERASEGDVSVNRSVEERYERLLHERGASRLRGELSASLKKALGRAERRVEAVSGDLASAEKANDYRRAGELVLAHLKALSRGMEAADLTGYDGGTVTVKLDPRLSPSDNAARYFRKYKKAKAGLAHITQRLNDARAEASALHAFLAEVGGASDLDELTALKSRLMKKGPTGRRAPGERRNKEEAASPPFRKFDYAGWDILVGKTAAGNDYLTLKLARPDDLWLHAEGMPGSHVLVRNPKAGDVPPDVLIKAAALAAYYSKGRGSTKVPVAYTQAKFVKKPKGAKPGTVTLSRRRTVMAAPGKDV